MHLRKKKLLNYKINAFIQPKMNNKLEKKVNKIRIKKPEGKKVSYKNIKFLPKLSSSYNLSHDGQYNFNSSSLINSN